MYELSSHALRRFCERYRPDLDPASDYAREVLEKIARAGTLVGPTVGGDLYTGTSSVGEPVPFVVRHDPKLGRPVVVTVLPKHHTVMPQDEVEDVCAAYLRVTRHRDKHPQPGEKRVAKEASGLARHWVDMETARLKLAAAAPDTLVAEVTRLKAERHAALNEAQALRDRLATVEQEVTERLRGEVTRSREHVATTEREMKKLRAALKVAVRALMRGQELDHGVAAIVVDAALREIAAVDHGFVFRSFYLEEPTTKAERLQMNAEDRARLALPEADGGADAAE